MSRKETTRSLRTVKAAALVAGGIALVASLNRPANVSAFLSGPEIIRVPGIVRDFRMAHPDFNVTPKYGTGHYASVVERELRSDGRPGLSVDGYKVAREWYNKSDVPIAPHLYRGLSPIQVATAPNLDQNSTIDSWDPDDGRYGENGNIGDAPDVYIGSDMPELTTPPDLGPDIGNVSYKSGANVINTSFHCSKFTTQVSAEVVIEGDVIIYCDEAFNMGQYSRIELAPDASLRLYVNGPFQMTQESKINMVSLDPYRMIIYHLGTWDMDISQYSKMCATVYAPQANLNLGQDVEFFGLFIGQGITMKQDAYFHSAGTKVFDTCGDEIVDRTGLIDIFAQPAIESSTSFDQWYHDVLGQNLSQLHTIEFRRNPFGVYIARESAFYPIDDRLFGNEGMDHNRFFTYTFNATFTYQACTGQYFELRGAADDAWLFINGKLVLDVGGIGAGTGQIVELERLELTDGQSYTVSFFYAQRNSSRSYFDLRTNVPLVPPTLVGAGTASFD